MSLRFMATEEYVDELCSNIYNERDLKNAVQELLDTYPDTLPYFEELECIAMSGKINFQETFESFKDTLVKILDENIIHISK